jgi:hypothetical protein
MEGSHMMVKASQFLELLFSDGAFRAEYRASRIASPYDILNFALLKGFAFSVSDLCRALENFPAHFLTYHMRELLQMPRQRTA